MVMKIKLQDIWQYVIARTEAGRARAARTTARSRRSTAPAVEIAPDDPIIAHFQANPSVTELASLDLDSQALRALQAGGVQLVVPLVSQGELIGLLNLGPQLGGRDYSIYDWQLLEGLAGHAAPALRVAQLVRQQRAEARARERIEHELRIARLIQQSLLPVDVPQLPGWQVAAHYQPAHAVGGDFYDFLLFPDGQVGFVVGDVTDKGVPAALVMATTRSMLRAAAEQFVSPGAVLERVNGLVHADIPPKMFVTCLYVLLDPASGRLRFANAGHDLPYLRQDSRVLELRATGLPLGLMPGVRYEEKEAFMAPGETIVLYSDGLVEAHNSQRDMLGFRRLQQIMAEAPEVSGEALAGFILARLAEFVGQDWQQEDDITLVALHRLPVTPTGHNPWRVLADFSVSSVTGNEREAMDRVVDAVQEFRLSGPNLNRLKTAVAETVMNAIEHGNQNNPDLPVSVRLLVSASALAVRVTDRGGQPLPEPEEPSLEAKLAGLQSPRGWGLFLIKNLMDEVHISSDDQSHTVELVLYLEGASDASPAP